MGCCFGCCGFSEWETENQKHSYSPVAVDTNQETNNSYGSTEHQQHTYPTPITSKKSENETPKQMKNPFKSVTPINDESVSKSESQDTESESFKEYKNMMQMTFYTFAGYKPYAKFCRLYSIAYNITHNVYCRKVGLFIYKNELKRFLEIVNVDDPVEDVLKLIDTDIEDGKITFNEWMDYFTNKQVNDDIFRIKQHIEEQVTWELLVKALKIFQKMDADHSGKLEYGEFEKFGELIGLNGEETEVLWHRMDTNESGSVDITELFEWFRNRLYQQRQRICSKRQSSLFLSDEASNVQSELSVNDDSK